MRTIRLYGSLAERFGAAFRLEVRSLAEACLALGTQLPGFRRAIEEGRFRVTCGPTGRKGLKLDEDLITFGLPAGDLDPRPVRKGLTVVGERIIYELRGLACLPLDLVPARRKGCAVTRSFSSRITDRATLEEAVAAHATRLGEKLRREGLGTDHVTVFYHTSEHDRDAPQRSVATTVSLPEHTSDTLSLIKAARLGVAKTWRDPSPDRPAWRYSKAGVVTNDLAPLSHSPRALIGALDRERSGPLMAAMDACNARWGRGAVVPARAGLTTKRDWNTKFDMRTPRYTTQVGELPVAHA